MKEILLALCGTSPAVITETVWAMAHEEPPRVPDRVVVLTTVKGRECVRKQLFQNGIWEKLRHALGAKAGQLCFGDTGDSIRIFTERAGAKELNDIQSETDGVAVGDFILEKLRQYTEEPGTRITFSIAGGRKSMSALGALAMTLLGREQDRLCHVLVNPPFEDPKLTPPFYFPQSQIHATREGEKVPDSQADITLHDIPFVRCRSIFPREYGHLPGSFAETVHLANRELTESDYPQVLLRPQSRICEIDGQLLKLSKDQFDLFWMLAERVHDRNAIIENAYCLYDALRKFVAEKHDEKMPSACEQSEAKVRRLASRVKEKLLELENVSCVDCLFPSRGRGNGYGLTIPTERVKISLA